MLPGKSIKITRELKLNRLVEENKDINIDVINTTIHIPVPHILCGLVQIDLDVEFKRICDNYYGNNYCKKIIQHITNNTTPKKLSKKELGITDLLSYPTKEFTDFLLSIKGTDIITNAQFGSFLQDSSLFNIKMIHTISLNSPGLPYIVGDINNKNVYVDPYMRWDDNRMLVVKKPFYDVSVYNISEYTKDEATFRPNKELSYTLFIEKHIEDYVDIYELTS